MNEDSNIVDDQVYLLVGYDECNVDRADKIPKDKEVLGVFADDTKAYQVAEEKIERKRLSIPEYDCYEVHQVNFFSEQLSVHL